MRHIGQVMNDTVERGLRFSIPDVRPLFENAKLTPSILHTLRPHIQHDLMTPDLLQLFNGNENILNPIENFPSKMRRK